MADTATANFNWTKPEVGSSQDTWGSKVNLDLDNIDALVRAICPVGSMLDFAGSTAPVGWLICDGTVYQISAYPLLGNMLKGQYGGDGTTTFGVPNIGGKCVIGSNATYAIGSTGGATTVTLDATMIPAHLHSITDKTHSHTVSDAGHAHGVSDPTHNHGQSPHAHGASQDAHSHNLSSNVLTSAGGSNAPGGAGWAFSAVTTDSRQPNVTVAAANANISAAATGIGVQTGYASLSASAVATGITTTNNAGGGLAHNNLQPYIAFAKIIRAA